MKFHLVLLLLWPFTFAWADPTPPSWDENRLTGFAQHEKDDKAVDRDRLEGRGRHIERVRREEEARLHALDAFKKESRKTSPQEGGPEDREDQQKKRQVLKEQELIRQSYVQLRAHTMARRKANSRLVTEEQELGLDSKLPRYEISKRALYGSKTANAVNTPFRPTYPGANNGGPQFPPSVPFDETGGGAGNTGYFPPPPADEEGNVNPGDFPAPPPAPAFEDGEFPPPPPSGEFNEFPPPPSGVFPEGP